MAKEAKKILTETEMENVTNATAAELAKQPKVQVKIPMDGDLARKLANDTSHKDWPFTTVQINGYTYQIKHGVKVDVPEEVYNILDRANRI